MVEFYFFMVNSKMPKETVVTEKERQRYMQMSIMLLFDYLKGFYFKVVNENDSLKATIEKGLKDSQMNDLFRISHEHEAYFKELRDKIDKLQFENGRWKNELEKTVK